MGKMPAPSMPTDDWNDRDKDVSYSTGAIGWVRSRNRRKFHTEATAQSFLACHINSRGMRCTDRLHDRKSESGAAGGARTSFISPIKALEHMGKRLRWNSGPVIRYLDYDFAVFQVQTHVNRAADLRVLDCIVDEVHDDLLKVTVTPPTRIASDFEVDTVPPCSKLTLFPSYCAGAKHPQA
jgi:hypothetical protein